jgi:hypothetical protein
VATRAIDGNTIRNIAAVLLIKTAQLRTGLVARLVAIRLRTVKLAPDNKLAGRVAICQATAEEEPEWAIELAVQASATARAAAEPIALEAGTSLEVAAETGMRSEGGPGDTTDRARVRAATAVRRAWDLVAAAVLVAVAVDDAGKSII